MLPLPVACFKTYLKETSRFSALSNLSTTSIYIHYDLGAPFQIIFHCVHHLFFNWAPTDYQLFLDFSPPSITCRCRRILSPWRYFVFVPLKSSELKVSKILRPLSSLASSFQDSPEIHINIFWSQKSFQFFNPHLHTVTSFQKLCRSCDDWSLSRIPSSAFSFVTSLLPLKGGCTNFA